MKRIYIRERLIGNSKYLKNFKNENCPIASCSFLVPLGEPIELFVTQKYKM